ncbi:phosphatidylserine decarboxylase [Aspergillus sclerotioniger CBS 115572]|uniref:Phosphatidylserine decarboxylase n=1 Tax=Aspergillus sclerotioniger CBS 115572 TaxID=1450535 RepID=A0A317W6D8_9EURO|nr:phosphatidylserine decarboxylase [Aspergillus sclerotioniger CBS 115572]PWY80807.1 phosphatidylserine decarboxylase [Aspergillus sclerotioniger CBS 115572]
MDFIKNLLPSVMSTGVSKSVNDLKSLVEGDPELYALCTRMFREVAPGNPTIPNNLATFIVQLNTLVRSAPAFSTQRWASSPLTKFIEPYVRTPSGYNFFVHAKVNDVFHSILKDWSDYLWSSDSAAVLTDKRNGWFSPEALSEMPDFEETFICDREKPHWGFSSWNDFFNRKLREGARPISEPNNPAIVVASVEGTTYKVASDIKEEDSFWIKDQPYSLKHMFDGDPTVTDFIGGTVYQAYIKPTSYHRWHAPVSGTVARVIEIPGTFCPAQRDSMSSDDWVAASQGYAVHTATRNLIFIETAELGLVCCLYAGLLERGSCETTVKAGDYVSKGEKLGMFHFGGSTHCLIFGPGTNIAWDNKRQVRVGEETFHLSV